jgi:epoxide hydrolase 4
MVVETWQQPLPHGISLSCRSAGERGRPVLVFLHGFPEAAFIWDEALEHFSKAENGGYFCVAPNLRGHEHSTRPKDVEAYRAKPQMQDLSALLEALGAPIACLVAHDWGGAAAWNVANSQPGLMRKLAILNSPHPGTFLRELQTNPKQREASEYMNFLIRPDAADLLREDDYRRLFDFFLRVGGGAWMTEDLKKKYREVWDLSLDAACNFYRASPLRPPREGDAASAAVTIPHERWTVKVPTLVIWGMDDNALLPGMLNGLEDYIPDLTLKKVPGATHWILHEKPQLVMETIGEFLRR